MRRAFTIILLVALCPAVVHAQKLRTACGPGDPFCNTLIDAARTTQARAVIVAAGANPVPGAPSTLGMRLGAVPRIGLDVRFTGTPIELPPVDGPQSTTEISSLMTSWNIDGTIGLFGGLSLFPTVGGFASVDLLASVGMISLPGEGEFEEGSPKSYAVGARIGVLQESFTAPGVSVTGMFRKIGDIRYGDPALDDQDSYFEVNNTAVLGGRAIVGKRLFMLVATVGAGYDHFSSDIAVRGVTSRSILGRTGFEIASTNHTVGRTTFFGGLNFTLLIMSITAEGGWQAGGDAYPGALSGNRTQSATKNGYYGTLSLRVTI